MQVKVADRQAVVTTQDEALVVSPQKLQGLVHQSVQACPSGEAANLRAYPLALCTCKAVYPILALQVPDLSALHPAEGHCLGCTFHNAVLVFPCARYVP
jgi:hypothetical protein